MLNHLFNRLLQLCSTKNSNRRRANSFPAAIPSLIEMLEYRRMLTVPTVTLSPVSQSVPEGTTVVFMATANGSSDLTMQWQQSTDGGVTFSNISGATSSPYSFNVSLNQNGYQFRAVFSTADGSVTTSAATLTVLPILVTTLTDEDNGAVDPTMGSGTSLREAINFANSQTGPQTINFASGLSGSISLTMGELPAITGNVTIAAAPNQAITLDGQNASRVFEVDIGGVATLNGLTIANGNGTGPNSSFVNGGGILNLGALTINQSTITGNSTAGDPTLGSGHGGAIDNVGTLTVIGSTIAGNVTPLGDGGGIVNFGTLTVTNSTFSGNSAATGGGIDNLGSATVTDSTFYQNSLTAPFTFGSGINNNGGTLVLTSSIVDSFNSSGPGNSLDPSSANDLFVTGGNGVPANGTNGDIVVATPGSLLLASLANNGGPTQTVAELAGSPAIGAGQANEIATDQRGASRHSTPDIGAFELVAVGPPIIVTSPASQNVFAGQTVTLTASAIGNLAPTVQWQLSTDGGLTFNNIPGATSTTYTFTATGTQNGAEYRAVFTNGSGTVNSGVATLTVVTLTAPNVTTNPTSQVIPGGISVTFAAAATGNPAPTVQWQLSTNGGLTFSNISGATSTTYTFTASLSQNNYEYRAVFTNSQGSAITLPAALLVVSNATAPVITQNPVGLTAAASTTAAFVASATGIPMPTVQWQVSTDGGVTYSNIAGATSSTYTFVVSQSQTRNLFHAVFTNALGSATTTAAKLIVLPTQTLPLFDQTVPVGQIVTFTTAAVGNPTPTVQWQVSTDLGVTYSDIPGANSFSYSFVASFAESSNRYRAVFTNPDDPTKTVPTLPASLTVTPAPYAPFITTNPTYQYVEAGTVATFAAGASGNPAPTVQWQVSNDFGQTYQNIPGATSSTYSFVTTVAQAQSQTTPYYRAVFTNSLGSATTTPGQLYVYISTSKPAVTQDPASVTVNAGQTATFTSAASGGAATTVQWQVSTDAGKTFTNIPGATSTTYSFTANVGQNSYQYQAVFTNNLGTATSKAATLTVNGAPVVTTDPSNQFAAVGQPATFTAAAVGNPTPTVQWQVSTNGGVTYTNIASATSATYTFTVAAGQDGYLYQAVFTNSAGNATSAAAKLSIATAPVITQSPTSQTVNDGNSVTFTAGASGNPAPTVQWIVSTDGGKTFTIVPGATTTTLTFVASAAQNGNLYAAVFTNSAGGTSSPGIATTANALLNVQFAPTVTTNPTSQSVPVGQTATFVVAATGNPAPNIQWEQSTDGGVNFSVLFGQNSPTLSFIVAANQAGYKYKAVVSNFVGSATSTTAVLSIAPALNAPVITQNPANVPFNPGATATFMAAASGNPAPTIQWQQSSDGGVTFNNILGATSTTLSFVQNVSQAGYEFRAVFTNSVGSATTTPGVLVNLVPVVTTNPTSQTVIAGQNVQFTAAALGTPTPTVQWQVSLDGGNSFANIPGATSTTYSFSASLTQTGNVYRAVFTNSQGAAATTPATLTVLAAAPIITMNPASQSQTSGKSVTFTAAATLTPPKSTPSVKVAAAAVIAPTSTPTLTVQWQVSTNGGKSYSNLNGATSPTLTLNVTANQSGYMYRAVFSNGKNTSTTASATLTVNVAPVVTVSPTSASIKNGQTFTLTAAASGTPTPTVQWQVSTDGGKTFTNIAGATSTTLKLTAKTSMNGYQYRAVFANSVGNATTKIAKLTVV